MEQDIAHYDRKASNDPEKSYNYLMRCARAVIDRSRLHWYREELSRSIGGGWVNPVVEKGKTKGNGKKGKGKDKPKGSSGNGDRKGGKRDKGSRGRSQSPDRNGKGGKRDSSASRDGKKEVCRMHLMGKCKAGDSCNRIHNQPCRFFQKGACTKGKDCVYPHHQPTAAAAKSDDEPGDDSTGEKHQSRGRSKDRGRKRSQTPGKAGVCRASSWVTGDRTFRACAAPTSKGPLSEGRLLKSFKLSTTTPRGRVAFGTVRIYARELIDDESINCELEPVIRNPDYKHPAKLRDLPTKLAAECAVDRAQDLIEQIKEDELEENGHFAKETARLSREDRDAATSPVGERQW